MGFGRTYGWIIVLLLICNTAFGQRMLVNGWRHGGGPPPTPQTVRMYFEGTGSSAISPTFGSWTVTTGAIRRPLTITDNNTSAFQATANITANNQTALAGQFVSVSTVASNVTITGTVRGQVRCLASSAFSTTAYTTVLIRVISSGGTVRGTLLNTLSTGAGGSNITDATYTNRYTPASTAMTSVSAQTGDYVVVEVGVTLISSGAFPRNYTFPFQTLSGSDLPVNETATSGNSWIEFAFDQTVF